jgi:mRNA-degrading endonuclease RelE of RelBE toxin-antitoxin system
MTSKSPVQVIAAIHFAKNLKRLSRKYRHIQDDVSNLIHRLEQGLTPGDQVPGVGYTVYKVRLKSIDLKRGKQGGFRVIYYVRLANQIILITIYAKSQQNDISPEMIKRLIEDYHQP